MVIGASLWAVRLVFIFVVGDHWFGTLGVTGALLGTITILSWKGRLGRFGAIYRQILTGRIMTKVRRWGIIASVLLIYLTGTMSAGMHYSMSWGAEETRTMIETVRQSDPEMLTVQGHEKRIIQQVQSDPWRFAGTLALGFLAIPVLAILDFPLWSVLMGTVNYVFSGHAIHFIDIALVAEIESLILASSVHYISRKKPVTQ